MNTITTSFQLKHISQSFSTHIAFLALILSAFMTASCNKDDDVDVLPDGYGTIQFEMARANVYTVSSLAEAKTIKVTVVDEKANKTELPSLDLNGNEDLISTNPYALPAGHYIIQSYRCFDMQGNMIEDLDITMTKENEFEILPGMPTQKALTVQVKKVLTASNIYNTLYGLCLEALGSDKSKWPPSWNFDGEGIDQTWCGLEFEWDVATDSPSELIGLVIDGNEEYEINSDTWEERLVSLPEFKHMKRLPGCIANITTLDGITIRNCDMEEIDPDLQYSPLTSLTITNTRLKRIPEELGNLKHLCDVWIEGNQLVEFPEALTNCHDIYAFVLKDEPGVTSVPMSIQNWSEKLISFSISGTGIKELPDVFDKLYKISTIELENNPNLSTLPETIGLTDIPYSGGGFTPTGITGLVLDGCSFTSIPDVAKRARMQYFSICNNKITNVSKADFDAMPDLQTLRLDGNKLSTFPALTNPLLGYLSLMNCGLHKSQVDISGLPNLSPYYFYCDE